MAIAPSNRWRIAEIYDGGRIAIRPYNAWNSNWDTTEMAPGDTARSTPCAHAQCTCV